MSLKFTKDDYGFYLEFTIKKPDGTPYDLTGKTVTFKMAELGAASSKIVGSVEIIDAPNGKCRYLVSSTDFDTKGDYLASLIVEDATSRETTDRFTIRIIEKLP